MKWNLPGSFHRLIYASHLFHCAILPAQRLLFAKHKSIIFTFQRTKIELELTPQECQNFPFLYLVHSTFQTTAFHENYTRNNSTHVLRGERKYRPGCKKNEKEQGWVFAVLPPYLGQQLSYLTSLISVSALVK